VAGNFFIIRIWEKCYGTCDVISLFDFSGDSNPHAYIVSRSQTKSRCLHHHPPDIFGTQIVAGQSNQFYCNLWQHSVMGHDTEEEEDG